MFHVCPYSTINMLVGVREFSYRTKPPHFASGHSLVCFPWKSTSYHLQIRCAIIFFFFFCAGICVPERSNDLQSRDTPRLYISRSTTGADTISTCYFTRRFTPRRWRRPTTDTFSGRYAQLIENEFDRNPVARNRLRFPLCCIRVPHKPSQ